MPTYKDKEIRILISQRCLNLDYADDICSIRRQENFEHRIWYLSGVNISKNKYLAEMEIDDLKNQETVRIQCFKI